MLCATVIVDLCRLHCIRGRRSCTRPLRLTQYRAVLAAITASPGVADGKFLPRHLEANMLQKPTENDEDGNKSFCR